MATTGEHNLRQQLEQLHAELTHSAPPEVLALMRTSNEELLATGIVDQALKAGNKAPDFSLPNAVGKPYHLADGLARGPVIVTFYRGRW